ncbi:MAG: hypothetical protein NUV57_03440, partial [archaeon]|nr:hypothetical protein [archaeon]
RKGQSHKPAAPGSRTSHNFGGDRTSNYLARGSSLQARATQMRTTKTERTLAPTTRVSAEHTQASAEQARLVELNKQLKSLEQQLGPQRALGYALPQKLVKQKEAIETEIRSIHTAQEKRKEIRIARTKELQELKEEYEEAQFQKREFMVKLGDRIYGQEERRESQQLEEKIIRLRRNIDNLELQLRG